MKSYQSMWRTLALIGIQAILVFVIGFRLVGSLVLPDSCNPFAPSWGLAFLLAVLLPPAGVIVYFGCCRAPRRTLAQIGWTKAGLWRSVLYGLAGAAACTSLLFLVLWASGERPADIMDALLAPSASERLVFLIIGLHAAFTEETLFRGSLLAALDARLPRWAALLAMAAVFAIYHLQLRPIALVTKFGFGIIFGFLRCRADSLFAPAVAHAMFWLVAGFL